MKIPNWVTLRILFTFMKGFSWVCYKISGLVLFFYLWSLKAFRDFEFNSLSSNWEKILLSYSISKRGLAGETALKSNLVTLNLWFLSYA